MRVAIGVFCHETSTFTPVQTTWDNYRNERFGYLVGDELITTFRGTGTSVGGFIQAADDHGFELVPTILANASRARRRPATSSTPS